MYTVSIYSEDIVKKDTFITRTLLTAIVHALSETYQTTDSYVITNSDGVCQGTNQQNAELRRNNLPQLHERLF